MIVKAAYYGYAPVKCIYLDGKIVWQARDPPMELSMWYSSELDLCIRMDDGTVLALPTAVGNINVEQDVICTYDVSALAAVAKQVYVDGCVTLITCGKNRAMALSIGIGNHNADILIPVTQLAYGLAASAIAGEHNADYTVYCTYQATGIVGQVGLVDHSVVYEILTMHRTTGNVARAEIGSYTADYDMVSTHRATGVAGVALMIAHGADFKVLTTHLETGVTALAEPGVHRSDLVVEWSKKASAVAADALWANHEADLLLEQHAEQYGVDASTAILSRIADEKATATLIGSAKAVPAASANHDAESGIEDAGERNVSALPVASGFTEDKAGEYAYLNGTLVRLVSCSSRSVVTIQTEEIAAISDRPEYVYPVQTETDLYIPMIRTAVQIGAELIF